MSSREQGKQGVTLDRIKPRRTRLTCGHELSFSVVPEEGDLLYCRMCERNSYVEWVEPKNAST